MENPKILFGIKIKNLREGKGWTQENLAGRMDISTNYLSSIERGKENPTFDMLMKFSEGLDVEAWELFDFGHEVSPVELRRMLTGFAKDLDETKLRLAVKVLRAVTR